MNDAAAESQLDHRAQRDRALRHSMSSGAGVRVVTLVLATLTISISARSLGDSAFGLVATLGTVVGLTGFADLGLGLGLMTRLAQSRGEDDDAIVRPLVSSAFASLAAIGLLVGAIGVASVFVLPWELILGSPDVPDSAVTASVVIFAVSVGIAIPASIGQRILLGTQRGTTANLWSLVASAGQFVAVIAAAGLHAPVWLFVAATISMPVLVAAVQSAWLLSRVSPLRPGRQHVSPVIVRHLLHVGGLFFALNVAVAVAYQSDTLVVSSVLGASSAAVFAIGLRMFGAASGLLTSSLRQFWPALAEALSRRDLQWTRRRFKQILISSTAALAGASALILVFGQQLARLWVGESLVPPVGLLVAMALWTVYGHVMSLCSTLLNAGRVVAPQVTMATLMTCLNLPLSIVLTIHLGLPGPVLGSLIAHVLTHAVPVALLVRRLLTEGIRE